MDDETLRSVNMKVGDRTGDELIGKRADLAEADIKESIKRYKDTQANQATMPVPLGYVNTEPVTADSPAPKMPGLISGYIKVIVISFIMCYFLDFNTRSGQLFGQLPMQIFWTACFYRLVQLGDRIGGTRTPPSTVAVISLVSFVLTPHFPPPAGSIRWLDPFFLVWAASQFAAPWLVGRGIDSCKGSSAGAGTNSSMKLAMLGNAYLLLGIIVPPIVSLQALYIMFWMVSTYCWMSAANKALLARLADLNAGVSDKEKAFVSGEDLELRYRAFAGLERWLTQRFSAQGIAQSVKVFVMWIVGPVLVIAGVVGTMYLFKMVTDGGLGAGAMNPFSAANSQISNAQDTTWVRSYVLSFITFFCAAIYAAFYYYKSKPTHILLNPKGLCFGWRKGPSKMKRGPVLQWSNIQHIGIERPKGQTSTLNDLLVLKRANGTDMKIKLDSLDSYEDKEWVLKAIKAWAPSVNRDAAVLQSLQPPADYSYTELWLQALSAPPQRERLKPLVAGVRLRQGKYVVRNSLGVGGQGQAYLATDALTGQSLVLKEFILPVFVDISVRKSALEQFENEARILRQLNHPQIVKLLDYFVEDHRAYLVLEHIDGASLRKLVESQGPLPEAQVRVLAEQMSAILKYLHNLAPPVVHRDFTPDNLILNVDGTLKLIDFNVAQQQESTTSGTVVGKHAYLPPEQFRGMPTSQSDIYAMGATLFFLLTGNDPEPISVSHPRKTNSAISERMDKVVAKATAMNLRDRYATIEFLSEDL